MKRYGQVIKIKPEKLEYYRELHAHPWPDVIQKIYECNIRNYSIYFLQDHTLFAYFEYIGSNFEEDMKKMSDDPITQKWWKETDPCQESFGLKPNEWWHNMEEVFHCD
ncbi:MAG: L-rhamnose mutarotase [Bacteroidetes bacterium HGW-Bacteroidetes-20]|nr:MAG: L-rhamnose mutarotase [Bacteroidetes bacterium HGW-Bacteroidetes-20]